MQQLKIINYIVSIILARLKRWFFINIIDALLFSDFFK